MNELRDDLPIMYDLVSAITDQPCQVCGVTGRRFIEFGAVTADGRVKCTRQLCSERCCILWQQFIGSLTADDIYSGPDGSVGEYDAPLKAMLAVE